ncbi:hypothetical protein NQZ68_038634 [Dissostichus eleginoides]|nr:hypothetical protein NQZ68_038634 [Dissostichus eleginoides]
MTQELMKEQQRLPATLPTQEADPLIFLLLKVFMRRLDEDVVFCRPFSQDPSRSLWKVPSLTGPQLLLGPYTPSRFRNCCSCCSVGDDRGHNPYSWEMTVLQETRLHC